MAKASSIRIRTQRAERQSAANEGQLDWLLWSDPDHWPEDAPELVFLGRAVFQLARAFFGPAWRLPDLTAEALRVPAYKDRFQAKLDQVVRLNQLARGLMPEAVRKMQPYARQVSDFMERWSARRRGTPDFLTIIKMLPQRAWNAAKAVADQDDELLLARKREWEDLLDQFIDHFRNGRLKAYTRPELGGELEPVIEQLWYSERPRLVPRFIALRLDRSAPFDEALPIQGEFLFVESASLDGLIAAIPGRDQEVGDDLLPGASDMMKAMLEVWLHFHRRPDLRYQDEVVKKVREVFADKGFIKPILDVEIANKRYNDKAMIENITTILRGSAAKSGHSLPRRPRKQGKPEGDGANASQETADPA